MTTLFQNDSIKVSETSSPTGRRIGLVTLDMPGKSANVLTSKMFSDLDQAWGFVEQQSFAGAVIVSAKQKIFVAGADLVAISETLDWPDERIVQFCEDGRDIFRRFREVPFPTVAAVHGACVGGGFELALWCDYRVASDHPRTQFGLPEVKLGLVPGWAGTCLLPRIVGVDASARMISLAENMNSQQALKVAAVSRVVDQAELLAAANELIDEQIESREFLRDREKSNGAAQPPNLAVDPLRDQIQTVIRQSKDVDHFAAEIVLEQVLTTWNLPLGDACDQESLAMTRVYGSETCAGLLNSFFLNERARKSGSDLTRNAPPRELKTIGILGCGQMGGGIAELFVQAGVDVVLFDADPQRLEQVGQSLQRAAGNSRVQAAAKLEETAGCDFFIESIQEDVQAKRNLLQQLSTIASPDAVFATNTSVIQLKHLVDSITGPERFLGLHFCSPVAFSLVTEVVRGSETSDRSLATAIQATRVVKKHPVVVNDGPGFVINRILAGLFDEANRLLLNGTEYPAIDLAMREFGFPVGPFEMMDVIGNDIVYHAGKTSFTLERDSVFLSPVQPKMVKKKFLGCKNLLGYYDYRDFELEAIESHPAPVNPEASGLVQQYQENQPACDGPEIQERLLLMMLSVACEVLDERIVDDPREVDICLQFGLQFPANRGGLFYWADRLGIEHLKHRFEHFQKRVDARQFATPPRLQKLSDHGSHFYA